MAGAASGCAGFFLPWARGFIESIRKLRLTVIIDIDIRHPRVRVTTASGCLEGSEALRYGIVRVASYLPTADWQWAMLEGLGCDLVQEVYGEDFATDRRVGHVLFQLAKGDEIVVHNLAVLARNMVQTVRVLRNLIELDVSVLVSADGSAVNAITSADSAFDVLAFLAEQEHQRFPDSAMPDRRRVQGGSHNPLSKYQIDHARKLYAQGTSLRAIGLVFQVSPNDVWSAIAPPGVVPRVRSNERS